MKIIKSILLIAGLILICFTLVGQDSNLFLKHDYVWAFGREADESPPRDSLWGRVFMDFNYAPPIIYYDGFKNMELRDNTISISDKDGNFLFTGNGHWLENHANLSIAGDNFFTDGRNLSSLPGLSYTISLEEDNHFGYLHSIWGRNGDVCGKEWWYSVVDMNRLDGLGQVLSRTQILSDTLAVAKIAGVRHANGKDWWFLTRKFNTNQYLRLLFDGEGFSISEQEIGEPTFAGIGQAVFSPDGAKYATASAINPDDGRYFDLYDFNRCNGELSNHLQVHGESPGLSGGIAFSPNSRFLYVTGFDKILQYDTWENDILGTETVVAEYDLGVDTVITGPTTAWVVPTHFYLMQLAPDGKIYVNTPNTTYSLHVIEYPDQKGVACRVNQRAIQLPTPNNGIPMFPNFRLGPIDGSACDTLGIDNFPVANFRYEDFTDTFHFRDLSVGVPTDWFWDFGDGTTSTEQHNNHFYEIPDEYRVCLTVSNDNGSNTLCDTIQFGISNTEEIAQLERIQSIIYPNPTNDKSWLELSQPLKKPAVIHVYDALGQLVLQYNLQKGAQNYALDFSELISGLYFYNLKQEGSIVGKGKLVKR